METPATTGPVRILIADDEPPLLRMMSVYLRRLGYGVTTFDRTDQVLALTPAQMGEFTVAVLDATMDGTPLETLAVEMLRVNPQLRILTASGYPIDMSVLEAAAPGRVAFLHKPFSPETLAATVRRMIAPEEKKEGKTV
jgi:two-component system, cell cycle sensor histidine kinase and response regulator CckA